VPPEKCALACEGSGWRVNLREYLRPFSDLRNETVLSLFKLTSVVLSFGACLAFTGVLTSCSSSDSGGGTAAAGSGGSGVGGSGAAGTAGAITSVGGSSLGGGGTGGLSGVAGSSGAPAATAGAGGLAQAGGGSPGAAGASGGAAGSAAVGGAGACPSNAIFCADFEAGTIPSAAVFFPAYQQSMVATYMNVDATVAHGGTHSLKVTPGSNFSQMLGVMTGTPTFWTRMYLRQDINTNTVMGHDTFVTATDSNGDPNMGAQIRVGEHSCQLELNRASDDKEILSDAMNGTSNYTCAGGITFMPNTWYCLQTFYDGPNSTVRVFVNSTEVTALHVTDWGPFTYDMFKFGFENYGGTGRNRWYDDVVIAPTQVGCN
jgi:hypothetical protein